jgi:hypothetical protein
MMSLPPMDADAFEAALKLWDRPEAELGGTPLERDDDVETFLDDAFRSIAKT